MNGTAKDNLLPDMLKSLSIMKILYYLKIKIGNLIFCDLSGLFLLSLYYFFLPEARFGLQVLLLPASVCVCQSVAVSITCLSARLPITRSCYNHWIWIRRVQDLDYNSYLCVICLNLLGEIELKSQNLLIVQQGNAIPVKLGFLHLEQKCIPSLLRSLLILDMIGNSLHYHF